ncbi:MAG: glucoamylase family protein [Bacteroidia bacterium]
MNIRPNYFLVLLSLFLVAACQPDTAENVTKLTDEELLDLTEKQTFQYFWDGAEPVSGLARERFHVDGVYPENDKNVVTSGGGGFGVMAIIAAMDRGYITREEGVARLEKITTFLEKADRFHGAWSHWIFGETGKVKPFSPKDDGGDIVETSYMAQGLLCARQYLMKGNAEEQALAWRMDTLWKEIDWDWYRNGKNILYWHWSPNFAWEMNFGIEGYNECLITYVLAASSPTHGVPAEVYHEGWARNGNFVGGPTKYGYTLALKHNGSPEYGGPLFWSHYSFLGLDPRHLKDQYADYWEHNRNHVLIDRQYCINNPSGYVGYGENCWGLTSSYSPNGYSGHKPEEDLGVISPTAALSSFPYTPEYSMDALRHFYNDLGDKIWGPYGFYDAFSETQNWYPQKYLAIDQGPIVVMIENHRSGLLWDLFMSCPEVKTGLDKLGFTYR